MPFPLRPQESVFFPQPFVETEVHMLVISNQRVVQFSDEGKQEMEAREVNFVGRVSERPLVLPGLIALLVGVPMVIIGIYLIVTAGPLTLPQVPGVPALPGMPGVPPGLPGMPGAAPAAAAAPAEDDPAGAASDDEEGAEPKPKKEEPSTPGNHRVLGLVLVLLGFVLAAVGGLLASRQRHVVLVRGGPKVIKIRAADRMEQTQILSTLQAVQTSGKASAPAAQPAKPKVQVEDGGDPVKALQELAAKRANGKIGEDEFVAKREVLLEKLKSRKG